MCAYSQSWWEQPRAPPTQHAKHLYEEPLCRTHLRFAATQVSHLLSCAFAMSRKNPIGDASSWSKRSSAGKVTMGMFAARAALTAWLRVGWKLLAAAVLSVAKSKDMVEQNAVREQGQGNAGGADSTYAKRGRRYLPHPSRSCDQQARRGVFASLSVTCGRRRGTGNLRLRQAARREHNHNPTKLY